MKGRKLDQQTIRQITRLKKHAHHSILHHVHRQHRISHHTLYCMKSHHTRFNTVANIVRESLKILLLAAVISMAGGVGLQSIEGKLLAVMPLLILFPAIADMVGDYSSIVSSKFSTMLYTGEITSKGVLRRKIRDLVRMMAGISVLSSVYVVLLAFAISYARGYAFQLDLLLRVLLITLASVLILVVAVSFLSIKLGMHFYKKQEDPNNFLIPITTSVADLATLVLFSVMVGLLL